VEPKRFFFSIFFLTYVIMSIFNTIGNGVKDVFDGNCWKWSDKDQQNINTCISGNLVVTPVGGCIPNKVKGKIAGINGYSSRATGVRSSASVANTMVAVPAAVQQQQQPHTVGPAFHYHR